MHLLMHGITYSLPFELYDCTHNTVANPLINNKHPIALDSSVSNVCHYPNLLEQIEIKLGAITYATCIPNLSAFLQQQLQVLKRNSVQLEAHGLTSHVSL